MFVRSTMNVPVSYHKRGNTLVIKPNTITEVDENLFSKAELLGCYGTRIRVITEDEVKAINESNGIEVEQTLEVVEENTELQEGTEDSTIEEANTGDEQVDAFLNGETDKLAESKEDTSVEETDKLPEGTEDTSVEETDKLPEGTEEIIVEETDKLPEGTEEIIVEETDKLPEGKEDISVEENTELQEASGAKEDKKDAKGKATGRNAKNSKRN